MVLELKGYTGQISYFPKERKFYREKDFVLPIQNFTPFMWLGFRAEAQNVAFKHFELPP